MEDSNKLEVIYDHYKETFLTITDAKKERNRYFIILSLLICFLYLLIIDSNTVIATISNLYKEKLMSDMTFGISVIRSLVWIITLFFTMRYYQLSTFMERQYNYIHQLEKDISKLIEFKFDRESENYLGGYPLMLKVVDRIYKWVFPTIFIIVVVIESWCENKSGLNLISLCCSLSIVLLTILYIYFLQKQK